MASFLARHGVHLDSERLRELGRNYVAGAPSKEMIMAGVEEAVEVSAAAALVGTLEQRYGEQKTTLFMSDDTAAGKDADGNQIKKSGTGIPMSAAVGVGGLVVAALVPMTPSWRRRVLNISTGASAAFAYRKGIEWGQKWLDSANKVDPATPGANPRPPFDKSSETIAGEMGTRSNVADLVAESQRLVAQKRAQGR